MNQASLRTSRPGRPRASWPACWSVVVEPAAVGLITVHVSNTRGTSEPGPLAIAGAVADGTIALTTAILGMVAWFTALFLRRLPRARKLMVWAGWLTAGGVLLFLVLRLVVGLATAG